MRVFISYRPEDCQPQANGLADGLRHRLTGATILMDPQAPFGVDQEQHLASEVSSCDVVLVLIGDDWLDVGPDGVTRRIDEADDPVRRQIETALSSSHARTVPVLVEGAQMPSQRELPESARGLGRLRAFELRDAHWAGDIEQLTAVIREVAGDRRHAPVHRSPGQNPGGAPAGAIPPPPRSAHPPAWQPHPSMTPRSAAPPPPNLPGGIPASGWVVLSTSFWCCGFAAFAPPLWGALTEHENPGRRRLLYVLSAVFGAFIGLAFILIGFAPSDAGGSPTGPLANAGGTVMAILWLLGIATAVSLLILRRSEANRTPTPLLPGTAEELERRRLRDEYRRLAERDPALALTMGVGRPDLARQFHDGGLVDLNHVPREHLARSLQLPTEEADRLADARDAYGRFSSIDEAVISANLHPDVTGRLKDFVILL